MRNAELRDPDMVERAQRAAMRLESSWERWRALQGLSGTPPQPVVHYVGYALREPWGQPRAVIGFSADEAERLADFLDQVETGEHVGVPHTAPGQRPAGGSESNAETTGRAAGSATDAGAGTSTSSRSPSRSPGKSAGKGKGTSGGRPGGGSNPVIPPQVGAN